MSIRFSVATPTRNRAEDIDRALKAFTQLDYPAESFEVLIVDNGSTDNTREVVEKWIDACPQIGIRYIYEPVPGLLSGRHRSTLEAKGEIMVFTDDDITPSAGWLRALDECFADPQVHAAGGPNLPAFHGGLPHWINDYMKVEDDFFCCVDLSLVYLGPEKKEVDPVWIWGLNYSIRKKTLVELGGFRPDCVPPELQFYQGDGETGLSVALREKGYKSMYHPGALVRHHIPAVRLTKEYFRRRYFYQGVCDSYSAIRTAGCTDVEIPSADYVPRDARQYPDLFIDFRRNFVDGFKYHLNMVKENPQLLEWVLREDYFDYTPPEVPCRTPSTVSCQGSSCEGGEVHRG